MPGGISVARAQTAEEQDADKDFDQPAPPPAQEVQPTAAVPPKDDFADNPFGDAPAADNKVTTKEGPNGKITYVERPEDSLLTVELMLDDHETSLEQTFPVYQANETLLVPLGKFAKLIDFPITVDTGKASADGWFIDTKNTFHLSDPYKTVEIAGKTIPVKGGIVETHLDDIYVSADLLGAWFPLELTLNYNELRLYLKTREKLPFQEAAQRRSEWEKRKRAQQQQPGQEYAQNGVIDLPYRMYGPPVMQLSHAFTHSMAADGSHISSLNTTLNAQTDLFGMGARINAGLLNSTDSGSERPAMNFNLSKESYRGDLLGKLHATRYELGDVATAAFPLAGAQGGRGAVVTNEPYNFVRDANNFRIKGFGPPGWDVEVYQNNELLAFNTVAGDGSYDFEALPLSQGFNFFKIVLYGPSGEREERFDRYYLGQDMVEPGKFIYNASVLQSSTPLLNNLASAPASQTAPTVSMQGEYGVTKALSAMGGYYRAPVSSTKMLDGMGFGLRSSSQSAYTQLNTFLDKSGGKSFSGLVTGNITNTITFNAQRTEHHDFDPSIYTDLTTTSLQLSKIFAFSNKIIPGINFSVQGRKTRQVGGIIETSLLNRMATSFYGLSVSNELEHDWFTGGAADIYQGHLTARYRVPVLGTVHGDLAYTYQNPLALTSAVFVVQHDFGNNLALTTTVNHAFGTTPVTRLDTSLDWRLDKVRLGLDGSIGTDRNKQVGVTVAYNLLPQSLTGDYRVTGAASDLGSGSLLIRPYIDRNSDGKYEPDEPLVQDVSFRNALRGMTGTIGKDGIVTLPGLAPNLVNRIRVDDRSMTDLSLAPVKNQILVMGKSGVHGPIDFAFRKSGTVSGSLLYTAADGTDAAIEDVHILLMDTEGRQAADLYSEYDGYFSFENLPIGCYQIVLAPSPGLAAHYAGDGKGPVIGMNFENPNADNLVIRVGPDSFTLENAPANAGCGIQKPLVEPGVKESIMEKMKSIGLKLHDKDISDSRPG